MKRPPKWKQSFGLFAEHVVQFWLEEQGYQPLAHQYRCSRGELDLILRKGTKLLVVEVKARQGRFHPFQALRSIRARKRRRILAALHYFLWERKIEDCEIEVVGVGLILREDGSLHLQKMPCFGLM